jgi:hypothetical protein
MIRRIAIGSAAMAALVCTGSLRAHHSVSMFDLSTPVWVSGTVVRFEPVNPHAMIELEATTADGQLHRWRIEGPSGLRLDRIRRQNHMEGDDPLLREGDAIEVCGFALKAEFRRESSARGADGSLPPFVHGHILVMADRQMQSWGSYGRIEHCVRPDDPTQSWLDFLQSDALAREFWCRRRDPADAALTAAQALVDEIDSVMRSACR